MKFINKFEWMWDPCRVWVRSDDCSCSDVVLDVSLALSDTALVGCSPVTALNWGDHGKDGLEVETAEAHPHGVEVPSDDPSGGEESWRFNELYNNHEVRTQTIFELDIPFYWVVSN